MGRNLQIFPLTSCLTFQNGVWLSFYETSPQFELKRCRDLQTSSRKGCNGACNDFSRSQISMRIRTFRSKSQFCLLAFADYSKIPTILFCFDCFDCFDCFVFCVLCFVFCVFVFCVLCFVFLFFCVCFWFVKKENLLE